MTFAKQPILVTVIGTALLIYYSDLHWSYSIAVACVMGLAWTNVQGYRSETVGRWIEWLAVLGAISGLVVLCFKLL